MPGAPPFCCLCEGWKEVQVDVTGEFPFLVTKLSAGGPVNHAPAVGRDLTLDIPV